MDFFILLFYCAEYRKFFEIETESKNQNNNSNKTTNAAAALLNR